MDKITIIGANRFIGFNLINYYLEQGIEVDGIILEQENDLFEFKKQSLIRNANYRTIQPDEIDRNSPIIIDAYLYSDNLRLQQKIEKIHDNHLVLFHKNTPSVIVNNYLLLENVFGEWDEIENENEINRSFFYYISDTCKYIDQFLMDNKEEKIDLFRKTDFEEAINKRNKWINKYKKK